MFKPLDIFWRFWNTRKSTSSKKVNFRGTKEDADKVCSEIQKTFDSVGGNLTRGFLLQHNKARVELRPRLCNHIVKEVRIRSGLRSRKSNCPVSNTFGQPLSVLSSIRSLPSVQTVTREDEVVIRDWLDNFRPVWQRTIRSKSTQDKAGSLPPASWECHSICFLFKKAKTFFASVEFQK